MAVGLKDGWVYFALRVVGPEDGAERQKVLDGLVPAFSTRDPAARLQQAVQRVTLEVPQLTGPRGGSADGPERGEVLEPEPGLPALHRSARPGPAHALEGGDQELTEITTATYGTPRGARSNPPFRPTSTAFRASQPRRRRKTARCLH